MTIKTKSLADLLPVQEHYFMLHDGKKYAKHGTPEANGLLVFETREAAAEFCQTVGKALPAFRPVKVHAVEFMRLVEEEGAVCMANGLKVVVATLNQSGQEPVNPEGVVSENSNWESADQNEGR